MTTINFDNSTDQESYDRASADLEMLIAAYPDEISILYTSREKDTIDNEKPSNMIPSSFPLIFTLNLPFIDPINGATESISYNNIHENQHNRSSITMEFPRGYPFSSPLRVISFTTTNSLINKKCLDETIRAVKYASKEAFGNNGDLGDDDILRLQDRGYCEGLECGLTCCSIAIDTWTQSHVNMVHHHDHDHLNNCTEPNINDNDNCNDSDSDDNIEWISATNTIIDKKSVFQAHICRVHSEDMVHRAIDKLKSSSNKIQRATHNMYAYRFTQIYPDGNIIIKHDNDDDGEDAAGSRLAHLLEMRKEDGVLVLVSRWFGGIHLGPRRFAHIVNSARELLVECHENGKLAK